LDNKNLIFFNPKTEIFQTVRERFGEDCVLSDIYLGGNEVRQYYPTDKYGTVFFIKEKKIRLHYIVTILR